MDSENSFSLITPIFYCENYKQWVVRIEMYLDDLYLWETMEENYEINLLPNNQIVAQIKRRMRQDDMAEGNFIASHKSQTHGKFEEKRCSMENLQITWR